LITTAVCLGQRSRHLAHIDRHRFDAARFQRRPSGRRWCGGGRAMLMLLTFPDTALGGREFRRLYQYIGIITRMIPCSMLWFDVYWYQYECQTSSTCSYKVNSAGTQTAPVDTGGQRRWYHDIDTTARGSDILPVFRSDAQPLVLQRKQLVSASHWTELLSVSRLTCVECRLSLSLFSLRNQEYLSLIESALTIVCQAELVL